MVHAGTTGTKGTQKANFQVKEYNKQTHRMLVILIQIKNSIMMNSFWLYSTKQLKYLYLPVAEEENGFGEEVNCSEKKNCWKIQVRESLISTNYLFFYDLFFVLKYHPQL